MSDPMAAQDRRVWDDGHYPDEDDTDLACGRCYGTGEILVCPDDLCRGAGECMHGDGTITCPACEGLG